MLNRVEVKTLSGPIQLENMFILVPLHNGYSNMTSTITVLEVTLVITMKPSSTVLTVLYFLEYVVYLSRYSTINKN